MGAMSPSTMDSTAPAAVLKHLASAAANKNNIHAPSAVRNWS